MMMAAFQAKWIAIDDKWHLTVETLFVAEVSTGELVVPVLRLDFGATNGMLLVTEHDLIAAHTDELVDQGHGFSCLSEPTGHPAHPDDDDALMDMLDDWGQSRNGPRLRGIVIASASMLLYE